jgi:hypothetical protein
LRARLGVRVEGGQFALVGAGYQEVARHLRAGPALRVIEAYAACGGEHDDAEKREYEVRAGACDAPDIFLLIGRSFEQLSAYPPAVSQGTGS